MKKIIIPLVVIIIIVGAYYFYLEGPYKPPDEKADERFGFLGSPEPGDFKWIRDTGAAWVRPHPGPFIWGEMQKGKDKEINFDKTDEIVKKAAKYDLKLLPTIWHYAEWDQLNHPESKYCQVKGKEFNKEFGSYRCNPSDWEGYKNWINKIVERYDGDDIDDMPDLKTPITHWEVFNEPDLQPPPGPEGGLQFFVGNPEDYGELLKNSSEQIKRADPGAKILIAGAAGGDEQFLSFYEKLFEDLTILDYFDIANVHCISSGDVASFNVDPYYKMLVKLDIQKPIWVTEAESFVSDNPDVNAAQLKLSTQNALELGVETIFFTGRDFKNPPGGDGPPKSDLSTVEPDPELEGKKPQDIFQTIFDSI